MTPPASDVLVLDNRHTGEHLELRRRRDGGVTTLELRGTLPPHRQGPPLHVHHEEDEDGVVIAGTLSAEVGGQVVSVPAGGTVRLPKGVPHRWWNAGDELLRFEGRVTPGVDLDRYLHAVFEVMNASPPDRPSLFYLAHLALRHERTQAVLVMPLPLQRIVFRAVVLLGHVLGKYRGTDWPGHPARCTGAPEPVDGPRLVETKVSRAS